MNRIAFFVLFVLLLSLNPMYSNAAWDSKGNYSINWYNSTESEFKIATAKDFAGISVLVNEGYTNFSGKTIVLTEDIDLLHVSWLPIGTPSNPFKGKLVGNGHKILGINISRTDKDYYGIFGACIQAEISDIDIYGSIKLNLDEFKPIKYVGSLCAYAKDSNFKNITSNVSISYSRNDTNGWKYETYIGGIFGELYSCNLFGVGFSGKYKYVEGKNYQMGYYLDSSRFYFGGIVANSANSIYENCHVHSISGFDLTLDGSRNCDDWESLNFGGLIGHTASDKIINSHVVIDKIKIWPPYGQKPGSAIVGGICVYPPANYSVDKGYIINCYSVISTIEVILANGKLYYGGIIGNDYRDATEKMPSRYAYNYSNNNVKIINDVNLLNGFNIQYEFDGNSDFSSSEMKSQEFAEALNLYYTLNGNDPKWFFDGTNYPYIKEDGLNGIYDVIIDKDSDKTYYYNIQGIMVGHNSELLAPGIYIKFENGKFEKILVQ